MGRAIFLYKGAIAKCYFRHNLPLGLSSERRQILVNFFQNFLKIMKILLERAFGDSSLR
jgi:hypothetical protein